MPATGFISRGLKMRILTTLICGAILALSSPAAAQMSDADAAIRAGSQKWAEAWNSADADALAALYSEDAVVMAPGSEPAEGRAAIKEHYAAGLKEAAGATNVIKTLEVMAAGDWAAEVGSFVANAADGSHLDHGRYIALWKKVDGKWMLYRDMWNSSM